MNQPFRLMLCQKAPMRDGVDLSADVYLPNAPGRYPALLLRTIYHSKEPRYVKWVSGFVNAGYAVVLQDCRGRHDSDGVWDPYICEVNDGFDTHEWVGRQPWCDGQVGTFGISYPGFTQTTSAPAGSTHLKALVPIASQEDNFNHHRNDGLIAWSNTVFFANMAGRTMQGEALNQLDMGEIWNRLPLVSAWDGIVDVPYVRGVLEHEAYGDFWSRYSLRHRYADVGAPAYFMTGWYDSLLHETLKVFRGWRTQSKSSEVRRLTRIVIGPWSHQVAPWGRPQPAFQFGPNGEFDDAVPGKDAWGDIVKMHLRWYDARLKGQKNGMDDEPPIKLFVMGANVWRNENEWPLARTKWTDFYLHGATPDGLEGQRQQGSLSVEKPGSSQPPDRFRYDPDNPCPTWGAQYQMRDLGGPKDRRKVEERGDVLIYTSAPLEHDLEVTGPVSMTLWASSSAVDTDFTASLIDVYPDGSAIILTDGICRTRFRKAAAKWQPADYMTGARPYDALYDPSFRPELMEPGTPYEFKIDMWETSNVFKNGHRVRLEVSSSNFPRYDRNLNTGGRVGFETARRVAHQTVFHDAAMSSRLTLPVIDRQV